jgi:hypothetical protein
MNLLNALDNGGESRSPALYFARCVFRPGERFDRRHDR